MRLPEFHLFPMRFVDSYLPLPYHAQQAGAA